MIRFVLFVTAMLASANAFAADKVMVMEPWCRPAGANTACYGMLHNMGDKPVTLTGLTSTGAAHVEAHETTVSDEGVAKMRKITPLAIAPDEMVTFLPEGNHIMVMGLAVPAAEGDILPLRLQFDDGTAQDADFPVHLPKLAE